jgi:hypothetical protein
MIFINQNANSQSMAWDYFKAELPADIDRYCRDVNSAFNKSHEAEDDAPQETDG